MSTVIALIALVIYSIVFALCSYVTVILIPAFSHRDRELFEWETRIFVTGVGIAVLAFCILLLLLL